MPNFANPFQGNVERKLTKQELIQAVRLDIAGELEAIYLYDAHVQATDNVIAKKVISDIRDEEKSHVGELMTLLLSTEKKFTSFLNIMGSNNGVKIYISSPNLVAVNVKGVTDFHANKIDTDNMLIDLSGVGESYIDTLICNNFDTQVKGTGDVEVKSLEAITAKVFLKGTGDVKVSCHKVQNTVLSLQGTGDIEANMDNCGKVNANLQGTGDITIKGNVTALEKSEHGTGDIDTDNLTVKTKN